MHDFMYSRANDDASFSLIGRRVCVTNRRDVTRDSVAFCTSTCNQIRKCLERSRACSVSPKERGEQETARARTHGGRVTSTFCSRASIGDKKSSNSFNGVRLSKEMRRTRWNRSELEVFITCL